MKKILFIATGGTIASKQSEDGLVPGFSAEELVSSIPEVTEICTFECMQLCNLDSTNIYSKHWLQLAALIQEFYSQYDGFIISHGTDTMAYTAAGLSYLIQNSSKPIILTGAQKPADVDGSDAVKNLRDSFTAACDNKLKGVFVVFCGAVIAGTRARKMKSQSYDSMYSINFPNVAEVIAGHLEYSDEYDFFDNDDTQTVFYNRMNPKVAVMKLAPGMKQDVLEFILDKNDAVIVESFGVGGLPDTTEFDFASVIEKANCEGKFTALCTQAFLDGTDLGRYGVGRNLKDNLGVLETYNMTVEAALAKLMWVLGRTVDRQEVKEHFYSPVMYDIQEYKGI